MLMNLCFGSAGLFLSSYLVFSLHLKIQVFFFLKKNISSCSTVMLPKVLKDGIHRDIQIFSLLT